MKICNVQNKSNKTAFNGLVLIRNMNGTKQIIEKKLITTRNQDILINKLLLQNYHLPADKLTIMDSKTSTDFIEKLNKIINSKNIKSYLEDAKSEGLIIGQNTDYNSMNRLSKINDISRGIDIRLSKKI